MSGKKKKRQGHVNHERWLVSYADFITLLFAFFVVMFASSKVDQKKMGNMASAVQEAFQKLGVFQTSNTQMPLAASQPRPSGKAQLVENLELATALGRVVSSDASSREPTPGVEDLNTLRQELEQALAPELQRHVVALKERSNSLLLSLKEVGFFDSGTARVRPELEDALARIAAVLGSHPHYLRIEGHTDNVPIHNVQFDSNWELSTARATVITKLLITRFDFSPERLAAAGYAEFHPLSDNDTATGRAANRRVDIIILGPTGIREQPLPPSDTAAAAAGPQKEVMNQ
jgi:chemotaxis protein MotB